MLTNLVWHFDATDEDVGSADEKLILVAEVAELQSELIQKRGFTC